MMRVLQNAMWTTLAYLCIGVSSVYAAAGEPPPAPGRLVNPLKSNTIQEFLGKIVEVLVILATPILVLFIMYAGFLFATARGNEAKLEKAKSALLWSVVGGVIVLGASIIARVLEGTLRAF